MNASFNLVEREWIPCVTPDGEVVAKGLLGVLVEAHKFTEIRDESPLVTIALHRLLLAILHRVFGPSNMDAWAQLWQAGQGAFDGVKLEAYLKSSAFYAGFDLFDAKHPFYQTAALPLGEIDEKKNMGRPKFVKPIWQMAHELAYSDSMNLFAHFKETHWETRPACEAARWLVAFQGFALGGLITTEEGKKAQDGSADAGQLVKSAVVLAKGDNLFQTLMLNLVQYSADDEMPFAFKVTLDKPAWEREAPTRPVDRLFDGYLDLLTWQSRRVKLVPALDAEGGLIGVSGVVAMKGFQLPGFDRHERETMGGFVKSENATKGQDPWPPLGFRFGRELWRDSHALFQSASQMSARPKVLSWADHLRQEGYLDRKQVQLDVFGISADRAKIFFWRQESLPLPLDYLHSSELLETLKLGLSTAETVAHMVTKSTYLALLQVKKDLASVSWAEADQGIITNKKRTDPVGDRVKSLAPERLYWSRLELPFRRFLLRLASASDADARSRELGIWFHGDLASLAVHAFSAVAKALRGSQREMHGVAIGENYLNRKLRRIGKTFPKPI